MIMLYCNCRLTTLSECPEFCPHTVSVPLIELQVCGRPLAIRSHDYDLISFKNCTNCPKHFFYHSPASHIERNAMSSGSVQALTDTLLAAIDSQGNVSLFL